MKFLEFFTEDNGRLSSTRLNTIIAAQCAIGLTVYAGLQNMWHGTPIPYEAIIVLFAYAGGTKIISKFAETKVEAPPKQD